MSIPAAHQGAEFPRWLVGSPPASEAFVFIKPGGDQPSLPNTLFNAEHRSAKKLFNASEPEAHGQSTPL